MNASCHTQNVTVSAMFKICHVGRVFCLETGFSCAQSFSDRRNKQHVAPAVAILLCFAWKILAQKRLSDFFLSVSKQTRNENEDKTVQYNSLN